jgi:nucleoside-diphosphate-sugar epimerase
MKTHITTEAELDDLLTRPEPALVAFIKTVSSPLIILGAGGKMGPTLALLARRAAEAAGHNLEIIAVSRFNDAAARDWLETRGVRTIPCDLLDQQAVAKLPQAENLIYLVGLKFGTSDAPAVTWAINTIVPTNVMLHDKTARIVALSTGNVYPMSRADRGGSREADPLTPLGEYPNSAVARERIFEFHSTRQGTPVVLMRLFYAVELRYGVLVDVGRKVFNREPLNLETGYVTCIWQGDANSMILRSLPLAKSPPLALNLCRPEVLSVREIAHAFGKQFAIEPQFEGSETPTALLGNSQEACDRLGTPATTLDQMIQWIAGWIREGGRSLGKPTHFEVRGGVY